MILWCQRLVLDVAVVVASSFVFVSVFFDAGEGVVDIFIDGFVVTAITVLGVIVARFIYFLDFIVVFNVIVGMLVTVVFSVRSLE